MTKLVIGVVLVLVLLPCAAIAQDKISLELELVEAAARGDLPLVTRLLENGVDANASDLEGHSALMKAAGEGHPEIVTLLIDRGADVNANRQHGWTALHRAVWMGRLESAKVLLDRGADPNACVGGTPLGEAVRTNSAEMVRLLLERGADPNVGNSLWLCVWGDSLDLLRLLLDKGADPNSKSTNGRTLLMEAAARDHQLEPWWYRNLPAVICLLLGGPPLGPRYLPRKNEPQMVKLLLEKGADVNARDRDGWTALKRARKRGATEIVNLLRAHGAKE